MKYQWFRDFLPPAMVADIRDVAVKNQHLFVPTTVSTGVSDYRRSIVLWHFHFMPVYNAFCAKLNEVLPLVQAEINEHFQVANIELQMTSSGDGDFFKTHNDNGSSDTENRKLTFVYYFLLAEPKQFSGGELILHAPEPVTILPHHNSIVFFPSRLMHEIRPVHSSGRFEDSRITMNGWMRG